MSTLVLDTSVAAAWYLQLSLIVPSLHFWELANVPKG